MRVLKIIEAGLVMRVSVNSEYLASLVFFAASILISSASLFLLRACNLAFQFLISAAVSNFFISVSEELEA
jgi:hypothetical protein